MLIGRESEQAVIDRLLAGARTGAGSGLVVRGEPGIGKSALLAYAAERAEGMLVLRAVGVEAEATLAYAAVHWLLRSVLDYLPRLPEPQARALRVVFGLEVGPAPERFLVAVAALSLLSEVSGERPVLCLVDDAHWADPPSAETLAFVARRLQADPVVLLLAEREGEGRELEGAGIGELPLGRLGPEASAALLQAQWGACLAPATREWLVRSSGGNPLGLLELPKALGDWLPAGVDLPEAPLPLTERLERAFLVQVRRQDPAVQQLLALVAAEGSGDLAAIGRAAGRLGLDPGPLQAGELGDLVRVDGATVAFRHPLVRVAAYHGAGPAARRRAHAALAEALEGQETEVDRRAWHRARAAEGPDEQVARELEGAAERSLRRAGHAAAAAVLEQAAALSRSNADQARRLVAAASAAWQAGDSTRTRTLLDRAERLETSDGAVRHDIWYLRGALELRAGVPTDGLAILLPAAAETVAVDTPRAVRMLWAAGEAAVHANDMGALEEVRRLVGRLPVPADPDDALRARLMLASSRLGGQAVPAEVRGLLARMEELGDPDVLVRAGGIAWTRADYALGRRLLVRAAARARVLGAAGILPWALVFLVIDELARGRCAVAEAYAVEGQRLALETGQPNIACQHLACLVMLAALRGREQEARRLARQALAEATTHRLAWAAASTTLALGTLALVTGHAEQALEQFEALWGAGPVPGHQRVALYCVPDLVEAAVRAGQPARGRARLAAYVAWTDAVGAAEVRALAARASALLASGEQAERRFLEALRLHAGTDHLLDHARTELLYGGFLRRERRRAEARPHLRAALETFERLGTAAWAALARDELRAAGEPVHRPGRSALERLTPQELQVMHGVQEGLTNREVAAQLFVSPRTVDHHLRKVFRKLGVSSRADLIRLALPGEGPADDATS